MWLLLRRRYDIVHLHIGGNLTPRLLGMCLFCSLLPWAKTVLTFHSGGYPCSAEGRNARPWTLRGFVFRRLHKVIAVNPAIAEFFRKFGLSDERIRLVSPYVPTAVLPDAHLPDTLRNFLDAHEPVLTTVGGLEPEYDLPSQVAALGTLRERFPRAGLVIIGAGSLESHLKKLIEAQPYGEHILLCGDVPHQTTLRVIAGSDLFLRTTLYDGDSIAVREALYLRIPVVATDNKMRPPGVRLIPPGSLDALCAAITESLACRELPPPTAAPIGDTNLQQVLEIYTELSKRG